MGPHAFVYVMIACSCIACCVFCAFAAFMYRESQKVERQIAADMSADRQAEEEEQLADDAEKLQRLADTDEYFGDTKAFAKSIQAEEDGNANDDTDKVKA